MASKVETAKNRTELASEQRLLLELRFAAIIGATLYIPTHGLLAILDFHYAPHPWRSLIARALSAVLIWGLVGLLHKKLRSTHRVAAFHLVAYALTMFPVFVSGFDLPGTFLLGFLPTLVALSIFLPGHARDHIVLGTVSTLLAIFVLWVQDDDSAPTPRAYLLTVTVNVALISMGGAYLASRRRAQAARWESEARRYDEVLRFGEELSGLGLLLPERLGELRRLASGRESFSRQEFLKDLMLQGSVTAYQAECIEQSGIASLRIGGYLVEERLGAGGVGEVCRARDLKTGAVVAIKRLLPAAAARPDAQSRFQREAQITQTLQHPNIVRTLEVITTESAPALVMEFIPGRSAADLLRSKGAFTPAQARRILRDITAALDHAHKNGVVHRDLKPANILLRENGHALLSDFGIAQLPDSLDLTSLTQEGLVIGTLDYMAPEQIAHPHDADIRADLYALGCTLYHLLTGRVPFDADTPLKKILAHESEQPPPISSLLPSVPADLVQIIDRLMSKDRNARFDTPAALLDALHAS